LRNGDDAGRGMSTVMRVHEFTEDQSGHQQYGYGPAIEDSASHVAQGSRRLRTVQALNSNAARRRRS
jgi:hypothetical protein